MTRILGLVLGLALLHGQTAYGQNAAGDIDLTFLLDSEGLAKLLESTDVKVRQQAARLLYKHRLAFPAMPALTKALKDPDADVRGFAAACFQFFGPPDGRSQVKPSRSWRICSSMTQTFSFDGIAP